MDGKEIQVKEVLIGLAFIAGLAMAPRWISGYFDRARERDGQELDYGIYMARMKRHRLRLAAWAVAAMVAAAALLRIDGGGMISMAILAATSGAALVALYAAATCKDRFR